MTTPTRPGCICGGTDLVRGRDGESLVCADCHRPAQYDQFPETLGGYDSTRRAWIVPVAHETTDPFLVAAINLDPEIVAAIGHAILQLSDADLARQAGAAYSFDGATPEQERIATDLWRAACADTLSYRAEDRARVDAAYTESITTADADMTREAARLFPAFY